MSNFFVIFSAVPPLLYVYINAVHLIIIGYKKIKLTLIYKKSLFIKTITQKTRAMLARVSLILII